MTEQLNQEAERAEFEAAYQKEFPVSASLMMGKFDRDEHGDYKENCVYTAYHLWKAARRASAPAPADGALPDLLPLPKPKMLVGAHLDSLHVLYSAEQVEQIRRDAVFADRQARQAILDEQASVMLTQRKKIQKLEADLRVALSRQSSAVGMEQVAWRYRMKERGGLPAGGWKTTDSPRIIKLLQPDDAWEIQPLVAAPALADAPQADIDAALNVAVDAEYPIPDNPHASVIQRATDNRAAMWRGINAARKILEVAQPVEQTQKGQSND